MWWIDIGHKHIHISILHFITIFVFYPLQSLCLRPLRPHRNYTRTSTNTPVGAQWNTHQLNTAKHFFAAVAVHLSADQLEKMDNMIRAPTLCKYLRIARPEFMVIIAIVGFVVAGGNFGRAVHSRSSPERGKCPSKFIVFLISASSRQMNRINKLFYWALLNPACTLWASLSRTTSTVSINYFGNKLLSRIDEDGDYLLTHELSDEIHESVSLSLSLS